LLEDRLLDIPGVSRIDKQGWRDREMIVEVKPGLLERYHVGLNEIIVALSNKNLNFPGGLVQTPEEDVMIRTIGEVETVRDIENVLIRANDLGNWVKVGDVARVRDSFEEEEIKNRTMGKKSITLTVLKKESADIIDVVDQIMVEVDTFKKRNEKHYEVSVSNDLSYFVKRRLKVLINNGIVGFSLVILSLLISLGWRISIVTALGLPLAFSGTFIWMGQNDITINLMSMFGLIMVLGMLVDDAIIVAENVYRHLEEGEPVKEAVINGTSEVIVPVLGTILTTIAAFAPLMFMTGIMGKFIWTLPAVVSIALVASWLESMFILPAHIYDIEKRRKKAVSHQNGERNRTYIRIRDFYGTCLERVLAHKYRFALLIGVAFFGSVLFASFNLKFILFPQGKIERFVVKAEARNGTGLDAMSRKISLLEKQIASLPKEELDNFISTTGILREQAMDPNTKKGSNYGTIIVNLTPEEDRTRKADEIIDDLRQQAKKYSKEFVKVEFAYIRSGPPVGKAVSVTIKGDDFDTLRKISGEMQDYLKKIPGLKDIKDNFEEGKKELRIYVDEKTASIAGISVFDVASTVRTSFKGTVATKIKKTDEEIDIRVIFPEAMRDRLKTLDSIKIANRMGNLIPLSRIATYRMDRGISYINRKDWKRAVTVTCDIDEKAKDVTSVYVNNLLMDKFSDISERYPDVIVDFLGEFKDTQESMQNLARSFLIAFIAIYIILVGLFRSLGHPFVIVNVIPLTFIGVIWAFYVHGMPLSFLALMGVVGLTGVIVNDSIVLMDFIKNNRAIGMDPVTASIDAGKNRLRPVFLTTITTFFGLIPTAYGIGGYDPFLKPMAISMSWGLIFGSFITLFATPILYNVFSDFRRLVFRGLKSAESYAVTPLSRSVEEIEDEIKDDLQDRIREDIRSCLEDDLNCYKENLRKDLEKKIRRELRAGKDVTGKKGKKPASKKKS